MKKAKREKINPIDIQRTQNLKLPRHLVINQFWYRE